MKKTLLESLNRDQQKALLATDGPILILAGAGSGKTRVLTHKVAYLMVEKGVEGQEILMVTFTNKAATEMKERIHNLLVTYEDKKSFVLPFAGTFHSLCAKILRIDGKNIGIPSNYVIYDDGDTKEVIKEIMKQKNISTKNFNPSSVAATISQVKNELISPLEYPQYARGYFQETVAEIYIDYQKILKDNSALDFDDLLGETIRLFNKDRDTLSKYQEKYHYVLVDEYQDTNHAQYMLTKLLSARFRNITVVGDASQSIYAWRGANYRNILNFERDFPEVQVFNLEQNYRSTQKILDAAFSIISKNSSHPILKLWTENSAGEHITLYEARDEQDEASYIIKEISANNLQYSQVAVLYRTNAQSRVIEEVFLHHGIPYVLVGGVRFYDRKEIKDVISYLRILSNPKDMISKK
ncbi:UvrD-helicase domain-containing protein [Candidatus Gottesmanbacteria bacterium]|nr:UvrD-helicase domain-containing protein [Candidatus Gottesmanbacteria bacterium]